MKLFSLCLLRLMACDKQLIAVLISNISVFCFGTALGWSNPSEKYGAKNISYSFQINENQWDWICSMMPLGAFIWSLPMGVLMKRHGCKCLMLFLIVPHVFGWTLLIYANSIYMVYMGRFIQGMCGAALGLAVPVYCDEISRIKYRGAMCSLFYGAIIWGIIWSNALMELFGQKIMNWANLMLGILCFSVILLPESPRFYLCRENPEQAFASLRWLRGAKYNVSEELEELILATEKSSNHQLNWRKTMRSKNTFRSLPRAVIILIVHQICGHVIIDYLKDILGKASTQEYRVFLVQLDIFLVIGHLICLVLIDRLGRRPLLIISAAIMCISTGYLSFWFLWAEDHVWRWSPMTCFLLYLCGFSIGFGPIAWILNVELIEPCARPYCCAVSVMVSWLILFLLTRWMAYGIWKQKFFCFLFVVSMIALLFASVFIFETKRLTSDRIQIILATKKSQWDTTTEESS